MPLKCEQYIHHKKRRCNFEAKPGFSFCGNHMPNALQPERKRVPCPWGYPHTCYESEVEKHRRKCPSHAHNLSIKAQAYVKHDINAGLAQEAANMRTQDPDSTSAGQSDVSASDRHAYAIAMGPDTFATMLKSIEKAYSLVCAESEQLQPLSPPECDAYLQPDNMRPFSLKHAKQQASIVGHMRQAGLLQEAQQQTYIEFGAGKGYLSSMLADASEAQQFVLLDNKSFRMKADRSLRKVEDLKLARLKVDIKDFDPAGVPELDSGAAPWVAIGKHLCGAATDFTLSCCASSLHALNSRIQLTDHPDATEHADLVPHQTADSTSEHAKDCSHHTSADRASTKQASASAANHSDISCQARPSNDAELGPQSGSAVDNGSMADRESDAAQALQSQAGKLAIRQGETCSGSRHGVQGLAVATCCHHRCSWQHYVGKPTFRQLGFTPEEFEVMSWMTGWALCGHETPNVAEEPDQQQSGGGDETASNNNAAPLQDMNGVMIQSGEQVDQQSQAQMAGDLKAEAARGSDNHVVNLTRSARMQLGQKCKRLIDFGRQQWLSSQGFQVKSVLYIPPDISGENRLLVATV